MAGNNTIRFTVVGDSSSLQSALKSSEGALKSLDASASKSQQSLSNLEQGFANVAKWAAFVAAAKMVSDAIMGMINSASQLESAMAGSERVFGAQSASLQEAAKAAHDYGLSQTEFLTTTTKLGAQLQGLGFSQDAAATSAQSLTRIGENLAAVFGVDVPTAMSAIGGALRGKFKALSQIGVTMTATEVQAKMAAEGISSSQAVIALAMEKSKFSYGAAAAAMDTFEGKQKALAAAWSDAQAAIGEGFLPVAAAVVDALHLMAQAAMAVPDGLKEIVGTAIAAGVAVKALQIGMGALAGKTAILAASMAASNGALASGVGAASVSRFSTALTKVANAAPYIGAILLAAAEGVSYLSDRAKEGAVSMADFTASLTTAGRMSTSQLDSFSRSIQNFLSASEGMKEGINDDPFSNWVRSTFDTDFAQFQANVDNLNQSLVEIMTVNPAQGAAATAAAFNQLVASGLSADEATRHLAGSLVMAEGITARYGQEIVDAAGATEILVAAFDEATARATAFGQAMDALFAGLDVKVALQGFREQIAGLKESMKGGLDAAEVRAFADSWISVSEAMFKSGASTDQIIARYDQMRAAMKRALAEVGITGQEAARKLDEVFGKRREIVATIKANADPAVDQARRAGKVLDNIKQNSPAKILAKWFGRPDTNRAQKDIDSVRQGSSARIDADPGPLQSAVGMAQNSLSMLDGATATAAINVVVNAGSLAMSLLGNLGFGNFQERWDFGEEEVPWLGAQMRMAASGLAPLEKLLKSKGVAVVRDVVLRLKMEGDWEAAIRQLSLLERLAQQTNKKSGRPTKVALAAKAELQDRRELLKVVQEYIRNAEIMYQGQGVGYAKLKRNLDTLRQAYGQLAQEMREALNAVDIGSAWSDAKSDAESLKSTMESLADEMDGFKRAKAETWNPRLIDYYNKKILETAAKQKYVAALQKKSTFASQLQDQLNKTRRFYNAINKLRASGLSDAALQELVRTGADQGADIAEALVGSNALRAKYDAVFKDAERFSRSLGDAIANDAYYAKIKEVTDAIARLEARVERWLKKKKIVDVKINWDASTLAKAPKLPQWAASDARPQAQVVNITVKGNLVDPEGAARAIKKVLRDSANRNGKVSWTGAGAA